MKISLNWIFDHIKGELSRIDVANLVDTFIKTTAEIEGWKEVTLNTDELTLVEVIEVMADGVTGFVVSDLEGAVKAVQETVSLDRAACRSSYEQRFTDSRMAEQYLGLYETVVETRPGHLTTADENPKP